MKKSEEILLIVAAIALAAAPAAANAPDQGDRLHGSFSVCSRTSADPGGMMARWWLRYMCWAMNE